MEYPLCDQTVTVYRKMGNRIFRQVLTSCWLCMGEKIEEGVQGRSLHRPFSLVAPGEQQQVFAGDRVMGGVGPVITAREWSGFLPAAVPGLAEVAYAESFYEGGRFSHVEAGG